MIRKMLVVFIAAGFSFGQVAPFENFAIGFWPEYDHPGVLVLIQIEILQENLPYDISLELPAGSKMALQRKINSMGEKEMITQEIIEADGKTIMPIHITQTQYFAQFYFNPFDETDLRKLDYNFKADKELGHFHVLIQEHKLAENFSTNFTDAEIFQNDYRLTFYRQHFEQLKKGDALNIQFSYENPTHRTTKDVLQSSMADHPDTEQSSTSNQGTSNLPGQFSNVKLYLIPIVVLLVIILGIIIRGNLKPNTIPVSDSTKSFCTGCGAQIETGNQFCTGCGRKQDVS